MNKNHALLQSLSEEDIQLYLKNASFKVISYTKNSIIHFDGEPCRKLEIILSGKVVIDRIDESGNLMTISEFHKDDLIGGNLLFSKNPHYPMTVSAQSPVQILEIERETLFTLLCSNPSFLRNYLELISDHAFILGDKIRHYINRSIRESVLSYLLHESKKQESNHVLLPISKKALAEKIGVERTSLSRELAKMRDEGLIRFDSVSITLLT